MTDCHFQTKNLPEGLMEEALVQVVQARGNYSWFQKPTLILRSVAHAVQIFAWDLRAVGISRLWARKGITLSRLFDYSLTLEVLKPYMKRNLRAVDVGTGKTTFASGLARSFKQFCVFDIQADVRLFQEKIIQRTGLKNFELHFPQELASKYSERAVLPFADSSFDVATSVSVLEHIEDDFFALSEMARILAPGGKLILMIPFSPVPQPSNRNSDRDYFQRYYTKDRLQDLLLHSGLRLTRAVPYTVLLKPIFDRIWLKTPYFLRVSLLFPLYLVSLSDLLWVEENRFYDQKLFLNRFKTPAHYVFELVKPSGKI
jgi:ubiquinone/menaquinone biosynthesis C-methylase UbiE